jgi:hypothetical protein
MKRFYLLLFNLVFASQIFSQHALYLGVKGGIGGMFNQYNLGSSPSFVNYGFSLGSGARQVTTGLTIPAQAELVYGFKKLRLGYQFEFLRNTSKGYNIKYINYSVSTKDTSINQEGYSNYFTHALLIEYELYEKDFFKIVPEVSIGIYTGKNMQGNTETNFQQNFKNRVKAGLGINFEFAVKRVSFLINPHYTLIVQQSSQATDQKGYVHNICLNIGLRFNLLKPQVAIESAPAEPDQGAE